MCMCVMMIILLLFFQKQNLVVPETKFSMYMYICMYRGYIGRVYIFMFVCVFCVCVNTSMYACIDVYI